MAVLSRSVYVLAVIEFLIIAMATFIGYIPGGVNWMQAIVTCCIFAVVVLLILSLKGFYKVRKYTFKDIYFLFEGIFIAIFIAAAISVLVLKGFGLINVLLTTILVFGGILVTRICYAIYKTCFKRVKNILIVLI